jgi:hypothetical protein
VDEQELDSQISAASANFSLAELYLKNGIGNGDRAAFKNLLNIPAKDSARPKTINHC